MTRSLRFVRQSVKAAEKGQHAFPNPNASVSTELGEVAMTDEEGEALFDRWRQLHTCLHEAGHAVSAWALGFDVTQCHALPDDRSTVYERFVDPAPSKKKRLQYVVIALSGICSERLIGWPNSIGARTDIIGAQRELDKVGLMPLLEASFITCLVTRILRQKIESFAMTLFRSGGKLRAVAPHLAPLLEIEMEQINSVFECALDPKYQSEIA